jgi:isocitrate/isopropylmalate dehydrogenase
MGAKKSYLVTLIPGDGIGPAVTKARVGPVIGASVAP